MPLISICWAHSSLVPNSRNKSKTQELKFLFRCSELVLIYAIFKTWTSNIVEWMSSFILEKLVTFIFLSLIVFIWSFHVYKINIEERTSNTDSCHIRLEPVLFRLTVFLAIIQLYRHPHLSSVFSFGFWLQYP